MCSTILDHVQMERYVSKGAATTSSMTCHTVGASIPAKPSLIRVRQMEILCQGREEDRPGGGTDGGAVVSAGSRGGAGGLGAGGAARPSHDAERGGGR